MVTNFRSNAKIMIGVVLLAILGSDFKSETFLNKLQDDRKTIFLGARDFRACWRMVFSWP